MFPHGPAPSPHHQAFGPPVSSDPPYLAQQPYYQQSPPAYAPPAQPNQYRPYDSAPMPPRTSRSPGPSSNKSYGKLAKSYLMNQHVEVQINANVWVMGVVVAVLNVAHKIFGCVYHVEYTTPDGHSTTRQNFWPSSVRDCHR